MYVYATYDTNKYKVSSMPSFVSNVVMVKSAVVKETIFCVETYVHTYIHT